MYWITFYVMRIDCLNRERQSIWVHCRDHILQAGNPIQPQSKHLIMQWCAGWLTIYNRNTTSSNTVKYPDCVALKINYCGYKVVCIYSDRSLYVWDITELHRIGRCRSILYHSACVWGVEVNYSCLYTLYNPVFITFNNLLDASS